MRKSCASVLNGFSVFCFAVVVVAFFVGALLGSTSWILNGVDSTNPANYHIWNPRIEGVLMRLGYVIVCSSTAGILCSFVGRLLNSSADKPAE